MVSLATLSHNQVALSHWLCIDQRQQMENKGQEEWLRLTFLKSLLKVNRSRNKIVMSKLFPKNEQMNLFFYPENQFICKTCTDERSRNSNLSKHKNTQSIQFRIMPFVCIFGEVNISFIFCFIFRDLLTFNDEKVTLPVFQTESKNSGQLNCRFSVIHYTILENLQ